MAHYAKLGISGKVIGVEVVADKDCYNADGIEDEEVGRQFMERIHSWPLWKKTSYNTLSGKHSSGDDSKALRGNYAGIGMIYDEDNDLFLPQKPYASWVLNISEARWQSPVGDSPEITDEQKAQNDAGTHAWSYNWNESGQSWDLSNTLA